MATPEITPRAFFSLREDVRHNAHYISDFQILYPAGSVLIMHNYDEKRQRYIKLFERSICLEMIVVSPSRKLAAIIENGEKGQILVFDMNTLKRRRTLNLPPDATTNRFETIAFTHDDTCIIAITGEPDWNMVTYKWEKGKLTSITKAIYPNGSGTVSQICCSPSNRSEVCLVGQGLFRLLSMTETVWRQYGFQKADLINITSACWLSSDRIICGTSDGKLFFVENGDLKGVYSALNATVINVKEKDDTSTLASSSLLLVRTVSDGMIGEDMSVRALTSFPKGFAYSCSTGLVHMFEKESNNKYRKRNVFKISDTDLGELQQKELNVVKHLSINVSQDKLLATTNRAQIYTVRLWGPDLNVAPEIPFKHLGEPLHHGSITSLTACIWKPIFATSGKVDRTVRLWNYETETVEIVKQYSEDILFIDLHPTGNFLAIVFPQKVTFSLVLMTDIQNHRTLPIPGCDRCMFSFHGNYLALVNQGVIEIYGVIYLNNIFSLKAHIGKINSLRWTQDDKKLASCGSDGAIFIWDTVTGTVFREFRTPDVSYWDIVLSADGKYVYAVGSDGLLKEFGETVVLRSIGFNQNNMTTIALSRSNLMMFLAGEDIASILSVKMPLTNPPEYSSFFYHAKKISQIKISYDDQTVISVSEGGSVIIWKLNFAEGKTIAMDKNFTFSTEILINKSELEGKIFKIKDLSQKLYELEMEQARDMRDTENSYCDKIREIHETFGQAIEELREKVEQTEHHQNSQVLNIKKEIEDLKKKQEKVKSDMIENYTNKLLVESEKVRVLDSLKEETVKDFESKVAELERAKEEETNEIIRVYEERLEEINNLLKESYEENVKNLKEHEIIKQHLEDDADREIVETKAKYEAILKEEKELNVTLKEEAINMKKKHLEAQKERDDYRAKVETLQVEQKKCQSNIQALEKDISDLKAEIADRDMAIEEKDEKIFLLKKRIQELDKFKFVLDYKIKELMKQIDPKDREIREKKEQIADMEVELDNLKKINSSLELQMVELREKITGTEKELFNYEKKHQAGVNTFRQIKVDLYSLYQYLDDFKKLKDGIKNLYHKYYREEVAYREQYGESDIQRELMVQREFLEKTIKSLKSTLKKGQQNRVEEKKVLQDNVVLLEELNEIRKEYKVAVTSVKNLEKLVIGNEKKSIVPSEVFNRLQQTLRKQEQIKQIYQEIIDEAEEDTADVNLKVKAMQIKLCSLLQPSQD